MAQIKKVFVLTVPASGHVNPMCGLVHEICKQDKQLRVFFYSEEPFRKLIEKSGAILRLYEEPIMAKSIISRPITERKLMTGELVNNNMTISYDVLPQIIADFVRDKPDLILYDGVFLPSKYFLEIIQTRHKKGVSGFEKLPKNVAFVPNFPVTPKLINTLRSEAKEDIWDMLKLLYTFPRQIYLSWFFGISIWNPIAILTLNNPKLNIVAVAGELQPYRDELDDTFKFVGTCVSETARSCENLKQDDAGLQSMLDLFDDRNRSSHLKLIYMSLGTLFHFNAFVFERAFDAFRDYNQKTHRRFKSEDFRIIISTGDISLKIFKEKITNGELKLPENILLRSKVPQLEILKRADLFITHCGMNSTTETIKYCVPVVAIPLEADQPLNAIRICDELDYGIRLDPLKLTSDDLADAVDAVLGDETYKRNISVMSKILAGYKGAVEGAKLVMEYLNEEN